MSRERNAAISGTAALLNSELEHQLNSRTRDTRPPKSGMSLTAKQPMHLSIPLNESEVAHGHLEFWVQRTLRLSGKLWLAMTFLGKNGTAEPCLYIHVSTMILPHRTLGYSP